MQQHCHFCRRPIESIDFHLTIKGGNVCPCCVPLVRSVIREDRQISDSSPELPRLDDVVGAAVRPAFF